MENSVEEGVCEECGCTDCAEYEVDPYTWEISGVEVMVWLCVDCYNERVADI